MRDVLPVAAGLIRDGAAFALATVVTAEGSSPREVAAAMLVDASGRTFGNVSGGCVDGVVYERCQEALETSEVTLERYGIPADELFDIGLACGGVIEVLVQPVLPGSALAATLALLAERDATGVPTTARMRRRGPHAGALRIDDPAGTDGAGAVDAEPVDGGSVDGGSVDGETVDGGTVDGGSAVADDLVFTFGGAPRLVLVGAIQAAVSLAALGAVLGWKVTVVDPRGVFLTSARFPGAEIVVAHPDRYFADARATGGFDDGTAVCVLSHDAKIDVPALKWALASRAGYVGAMGSRQTHDDRLRRLRDAGVDEAGIARLRSPIGLDLGGVTPAETALSILAEIVADRHGATGARLSALSGPVHARAEGAIGAAQGAMVAAHGSMVTAHAGVGCVRTP